MANQNITQAEARRRYTAGNNAGLGYAPYTDEAGDDTIENAVDAAIDDDWEVILPRRNSDDVVVLGRGDELMAIGGDAAGNGAWAVDVSTEVAS